MFLSNLELTNEQIAQKEAEFQRLLLDVAKTDKTYEELRDFFANTNQSDIKKYWYSYWRWYVRLTWDRLNAISKDELISTVFSQQVPMALLLDFDVWKSLMWYFVANNFFEDDLDSFYLKIKKSFLESAAMVGVWQGKNVTIAELIKEMDSVYGSEDSLAQADFESKLRQIMFPADEMSKKYFIADPEITKERFLYLVAFFETFTEEKIWFIVDAFLNPGKYQGVPAGEAAPAVVPTPTPIAPTVVASKPQPQAATPKVIQPNPPLPRPSGESPKPATPVRPTPQEIKKEIESQFKKDAEGNFEDIATVLSMLSTLSEKYNDPKIADMLYFDESVGKFLWSV